jgi:D-cysteine desulfhydrase
MLTDHLPRVSLAFLPTPLEEMPRLRAALGANCPRLLIKRDDQTGLASGGNKTRKLEFALADALQQNADVVITTGAAQSNHCRQTAAACAKLGLRCALVLSGAARPKAEFTGNLLLDDLFGAEIVWTGEESDKTLAAGDKRVQVMTETAERLRAEGHQPYVIPVGASNAVGAMGYIAAVEELHSQLQKRGEQVDRIVFVSGSGGTQAGILAGVRALGMATRVEGMLNGATPGFADHVLDIARQTARHLRVNVAFNPTDVFVHPAGGTHGYGVITDAEREAMRLIARTEGIVTDPVYTGRGLAGLIERVRAGVYRPDETVLFWHTGGVSGLFPRAADVMAES